MKKNDSSRFLKYRCFVFPTKERLKSLEGLFNIDDLDNPFLGYDIRDPKIKWTCEYNNGIDSKIVATDLSFREAFFARRILEQLKPIINSGLDYQKKVKRILRNCIILFLLFLVVILSIYWICLYDTGYYIVDSSRLLDINNRKFPVARRIGTDYQYFELELSQNGWGYNMAGSEMDGLKFPINNSYNSFQKIDFPINAKLNNDYKFVFLPEGKVYFVRKNEPFGSELKFIDGQWKILRIDWIPLSEFFRPDY